WKWTNWIIDEGIFPLFLSLLYTVSLYGMIKEMGTALLLINFNNYRDVYSLFANPEFWTVFWLHILAFDQVVAMLIYNDNQNGKYVPVWAQSIILLAVLFVGPLAMLVYLILRFRNRQAEKRQGLAAGERDGARAPARETATV
ncbi:MAG TPA: abscisic acid-deficient protein Aba4 family protein, partial [Longimicrobium sp.]|nr:abscisic acid-deficient protein Aba4 family protein [Longimicrobium sp.]